MIQSIETKLLRSSMLIQGLFSFFGIGLGVLFQSQVIFFEGLYSILTIVITAIVLKITHYIRQKDEDNFPFGKESIIPLVVLVQFIILGIFLVFIVLDGISTIRDGGSLPSFGPSFIYLMLNTIFQYIFLQELKKKQSLTSIIKAEYKQWNISFQQCVFLLIGYGIAVVLPHGSFTYYIDSIVLILFALSSIIMIYSDILSAFKELIGMSTISDKMYQRIEKKIHQITLKHAIKDYILRVNRVGDMVTLEVDFLVDDRFKHQTVEGQDLIRREIYQTVKRKDTDLWLNINFTTEMRWMV